MAERTLSEQDMVDILEQIAREGSNAAARIAAIKQLQDWDSGEQKSGDLEMLDEWRKNRPQTA